MERWIAPNEEAQFWLQMVTELKNRSVKDFLLSFDDGLKGFTEASMTGLPTNGGAALLSEYCAQPSKLCELEDAQGGSCRLK